MSRFLWLVAAVIILILPGLPIPAWANAPDPGPIWRPHVESWLIGVVVVVVIGLIVGRGVALSGWRPRLPRVSDRTFVWCVAVLCVAAALVAHYQVFAGNPHLVDEMAQLLHARAFASGRLALASPQPPEAFLITHTAIVDGAWVSLYPPGQTLLLAIGLKFGWPGLVNPLLAGLGAILIFEVARGLYGRATARAAVALWLLSAWVMFTSASFLSHVGATTFALVAWAAVLGPRRVTWKRAAIAGVAIGLATVTRPLDGMATAVPVFLALALKRNWRLVGITTIAGLPVAVVWGWFNWRLFGHPFTMGYSAMYGETLGLGFQTDIWGQAFTPLTAVSNLAVAVRRLHQYLFEWPIPALLPMGLWALLARQHRRSDLILVVGLLAGPALYFFYWHSGFHLGPRFYYIAAPWLIIGTARGFRWLLARSRAWRSSRISGPAAVWGGACMVIVWGCVGVLPLRWEGYRAGLASLKLHPEALIAAETSSALVLVKESWGSRVIVRLWGLGLGPGEVERAYRTVDACTLDEFALAARANAWPAGRVQSAFDRLVIEASARGAPPADPDWPDPTLKVDRTRLTARCLDEMREDLRGFTTYGSLAWRNDRDPRRVGLVFARDLPEWRDSLMQAYTDRAVYRWTPDPVQPNSMPRLTLVRAAP